jgi:hypothetical protein
MAAKHEGEGALTFKSQNSDPTPGILQFDDLAKICRSKFHYESNRVVSMLSHDLNHRIMYNNIKS